MGVRDRALGNPAGAWGGQVTVEQDVASYINNSGVTLSAGDVVVLDVTGTKITTTTTASDPTVIGVVAGNDMTSGATYAAGAMTPVVRRGPARINIAANTVAAGAVLATSTAAKVAAVAGTAASVAALQALVGTFIANALEAQSAKDANNTIRCIVGKM